MIEKAKHVVLILGLVGGAFAIIASQAGAAAERSILNQTSSSNTAYYSRT